jgi:hypothetical protein
MARVDRPTPGNIEKEFLLNVGSGPFVGLVKNNIDPSYMGRLQVYIPELGGAPDLPSSWITCSYMTPFYGVTTKDPGSGAQSANTATTGYQNTQQSYGMWMVPPDIDTGVLVMFVNSDPARAVWIGCIPDQFINHMIPGIASRYSQFPDIDDQSPVSELDKKVETDKVNIESMFLDDKKMPKHDPMIEILNDQGLLADRLRGTSSSTVRRETPSQVFGISTPGRGQNYDQNNVPLYRLPGHQLVMDDGDVKGANQLFRLRSATGHQIVMHDSAGFIYIVNASGTAWIEMTDTGRIDVYSSGSMSFNTDTDFNINAAGNININSLKEIRVRSINDSTYESGEDIHVVAAKNTYHSAVENINLSAGKTMYVTTGEDFHLVASRDGFLYVVNNLNQIGNTQVNIKSTSVSIKGDSSVKTSSSSISLDGPVGSGPHVAASYDLGGPSGSATLAAQAAAATNATPIDRSYKHVDPNDGNEIPVHNPIVPLAEPWEGHETREAKISVSTGGTGGSSPVTAGQITRTEQRDITSGYVPSALPAAAEDKIKAMEVSGFNFAKYREAIAARESRGRYGIENRYGYLGRYQFGVPALVQHGFMTKESIKKYNENPSFYRNNLQAITDIDSYWANPPGSKKTFLNSPEIQDDCFVKFTYANYTVLKSKGILNDKSSAGDVAGSLAASHLGGVGGTIAYVTKGEARQDQFGTSVASYYALGKATQT